MASKNRKHEMAIRWYLKVEMARRDMSAVALAEATGLSYSAVVKLRNRTPSRLDMDSLSRLCRALECKISDLLEYIPDDDAA